MFHVKRGGRLDAVSRGTPVHAEHLRLHEVSTVHGVVFAEPLRRSDLSFDRNVRQFYIEEPALLSDAEFLENGPKDVLDVNPAEQPAQGIGGGAQLLGGELLTLFYELQTPAQAVRG